MKAKLLYLATGQPPVELPLGDSTVTLGRLDTNTIQLHDEGVSRQHALLEQRGSDFVITDLKSTNGTKVNGRLIAGPTVLRDGDLIAMGTATLVFRLEVPAVVQVPAAGQGPRPAAAVPPVRKVASPAQTAPAKKRGGFPTLVVVGGVLVALCLFLACAGGGAFVVIQQLNNATATPELALALTPLSNPTAMPTLASAATQLPVSIVSPVTQRSPNAQNTALPQQTATVSSKTPTVGASPAVQKTATKASGAPTSTAATGSALTKEQDFTSAQGRYALKLPAGSSASQNGTRLLVTFPGTNMSFTVDYFTSDSSLTDATNQVVNGLKQRAGVKFATDRLAFVNDAIGVRTAAEYNDSNGKLLSHTLFSLQHDNGMFYLIQAIDTAADLDKDQAGFQRMLGTLAFQ